MPSLPSMLMESKSYKTYFMYITNKKRRPVLQPIYLCGQPINETNQVTTLGVVITNDLSWKAHITNLINKASKRLLVLRKYKYVLPRKAMERLYISILEYGDVIYDNSPISTVQTLDQVQHQAALLCTRGYRHSDYNKLRKELNWEPLSDRRKMHRLIIFYKMKNNIYPKYLSTSLKPNNNNTYNLRTIGNLRPRHSRLTNSYKSFFP